MSIWGKIIGAAAGMALGGPIGMLIGGVGGHFVDRMKAQEASEAGGSKDNRAKHIAFTMGIIVLGAKMAKADGQVTKDEVTAFKRVFKIPESEMTQVGMLFDRAKKDASGYEPYANQIAALFHDDPEILEELLWCLAHIAKADGVMHPNELAFLEKVARIFHIDQYAFERIMALNDEQDMAINRDHATPADYKILGVDQASDFKTIKAAYLKLARDHHPDHLTSKGMPEEFIKQANDKMARINAAFDRVKKAKNG
ncbi:MAG: TerB family tellurite resistance protein [Alphaproteobacteria bacterium]